MFDLCLATVDDLDHQPALEYSLLSLRPPAEPSAS